MFELQIKTSEKAAIAQLRDPTELHRDRSLRAAKYRIAIMCLYPSHFLQRNVPVRGTQHSSDRYHALGSRGTRLE